MKCPDARAAWRRIAAMHFALAMVLGLLWPPAFARSNVVIWEGDDQAVFLVPQDDSAAPANDHPVSIPPQAVEKMLASLRLRYSDESPAVAVFNEDQVGILGEALAAGLASAEPSQDITFSIIGAHRLSPGAFARRNRLTAGRVFFREGKLNVIFGEIQSPYRKKNIYGRVEQDFYPRKYGRRAASEEHESILIAGTFAHPGGDGAARQDWVVFDPERAGDADAAPPSSAANQPAPEASGIEQRLETLKRLRDKELISEDAYRQRVDEILGEL
jgi:hypothetical protein